MTKRRIAWAAIILVGIIALALSVFGITGERTVRLSQETLQAHIDKQLPREHKGLTIERANIRLTKGAMALDLQSKGKAYGQEFALEASGVAIPSYRVHEHAFYLEPKKLEVRRLELMGTSATDRMQGFLDRYVTDPALRERAEKSLPGIKQWVLDNIEPYAFATIARTPVYRPGSDLKGMIIKATLSGMAVEDGALVLTFSLLQLTATVLTALIALALSLVFAFALVLNPGWGMGVLALSALSS